MRQNTKIILVIGLFMLLFIVGFLGGYLYSEGQKESCIIQNVTEVYGYQFNTQKIFGEKSDVVIGITKEIADKIEYDYERYDIERGFCLYGGMGVEDGKTQWEIDTLLPVTTKIADNASIDFSCPYSPTPTTIRLHTHPAGTCSFSTNDVLHYLLSRKTDTSLNKVEFEAIYCGNGKFLAFTPDLKIVKMEVF
jgi:hypothetical protein